MAKESSIIGVMLGQASEVQTSKIFPSNSDEWDKWSFGLLGMVMTFPSIQYMVNSYAPAGLSQSTNLTYLHTTKLNVSTVSFFFFHLNNCCLVN